MRERRSILKRLERTTQLIGIAMRHGYGNVLMRVGWRVPEVRGASVEHLTANEFRDALADAGVTFIKLGQKLSARPDLLPAEYVDALATLQEDVPNPPIDDLMQVLEEELGRPVDEVFEAFDREPVAAASIGVVFRAKLPQPDGREVAVKVQRPGIVDQVSTDLHLLTDLAHGIQRHLPWLGRYQPVQLVDDFRDSLRAELDYIEEAARTQRLRDALRHHEGVIAPDVVTHLTTSRILVTEWIEGVLVTEPPPTYPMEMRRVLAHNLCVSLLRQAMEEGCFHGDPHAGNIRLLEGGRAAFLDFGGVTYIGRAGREQLLRLFTAMLFQRADLIVTSLVNAGVLGPGVEVVRFQSDLDRLLARHFGGAGEPNFYNLFTDFLRLTFEYEDLLMPSEWVGLLQSIGMLEGVCRRIDPDFSLVKAARSLTSLNLDEGMDVRRWMRENLLTAQGLSQLMTGLPGRAERLLTRLEAGDLTLRHEAAEPETFWQPLSHIINRLTGGIVLCGLLVASALMASVRQEGLLSHAWQVLAACSALAGSWLLWSIYRSGRRR